MQNTKPLHILLSLFLGSVITSSCSVAPSTYPAQDTTFASTDHCCTPLTEIPIKHLNNQQSVNRSALSPQISLYNSQWELTRTIGHQAFVYTPQRLGYEDALRANLLISRPAIEAEVFLVVHADPACAGSGLTIYTKNYAQESLRGQPPAS